MSYLVLFGVVLVSAIASFIIGSIWYSSKAFGDTWKREMGFGGELTSADKKSMIKAMGIGFIADIVKAFFLVFLTFSLGLNQFFLSLIIWIGFIVPPVLSSVLYEKRSWALFFISSGYQLASLLAMSLMIYLI